MLPWKVQDKYGNYPRQDPVLDSLALLSLAEVERFTGLNDSQINSRIEKGIFETVLQHKTRYVRRISLERYLESLPPYSKDSDEMPYYTQQNPFRPAGMPVHESDRVSPAAVVQELLATMTSITEVQNALRLILKHEGNPARQEQWRALLAGLPSKLPTKPVTPTKPTMPRRPLVQPVAAPVPTAAPTVPALPRRIRKPLA